MTEITPSLLDELLEHFKEGYLEKINVDFDFLNENEKISFPFKRALKYLGIKIYEVGSFDSLSNYVILVTNNIENEYKVITIDNRKDIKRYIANQNLNLIIGESVIKRFFLEIEPNKKVAAYIDGTLIKELTAEKLKKCGKDAAYKHYNQIRQNKNEVITENEKPKFNPFSFLDFDSLIKKVNDEDFTYQMNEAKICYENQLYLAACCTFSVCLETVLMQILEKNDLKVNDDSTMLNKIGETLREENVISKRANNRLLITYSVRNSTSHTNKNKVIQNDCEWILKTIEFFVDEYLEI